MKRYFTLLALSLLCVVQSLAYDAYIDGIYYNLDNTKGTAEVTCLDVDGDSNRGAYVGDIIIPSTVEYKGKTYEVTAINRAFVGCSSLSSITIPDGVTWIGYFAFSGCSSLSSITIPESVTSIDNGAFENCSSLSSITIPESVTSIGSDTFYGCSSLSSITIPEGVTSIGNRAFDYCSSLSSIYIKNITAWLKIDGLSNSNLMTGGYSSKTLYVDGEPVTDVVIEEGLTSIPDYAFKGFKNIQYVFIPSSVTSIGTSSFRSCSSLSSITIPEGVTSIGMSAFSGCSSLSSITIPKGVTSIDFFAFSDCSSLSSITLPEGVTSIGGSAFQGCSSLSSITLPEGVTSIGGSAFQGCSSLSSITLPEGVTSIGSFAFYDCSSLSSIYIQDVTAWCKIAGLDNLMNYGTSSKTLYVNGESVTSVVIEGGLMSIPDCAFRGFTNIQQVSIPSSVTSIGSNAFKGCSSLMEVLITNTTPPTITTSTFESHSALVVPDASWDDYAAAWKDYGYLISIASQRERIVTVTAQDAESALHRNLGEENLQHILNLKVNGSINGYDIMIIRNKMIKLRSLDLSNATIVGNDYEYYTGYHTSDDEVGPYAFGGLPNLFSVKLPKVTTIRQSAFSGCSNLHEVTLPQSLTAIQSNAFSGCTNLREINLPESLTTLAGDAFRNCTSLSSIKIPGSVETIGSYAFYNCSALNTLTLNEGLDNIGNGAFYGCKITDMRFPESLTTINGEAFHGNSFEEVNLPPNLNAIGQYAFRDCSNLRVVRLNPMLKSIADNAFSGCSALTKVYTYTLEPTDILQNTFSTYKTADLYVPTPSYYTYYYNTQWSQFLSVNKTDEEYDFKSFYITKDYEMDDNTGILGGDPDAELNENSGLINSGSETQELGTVTMRFNGNNGSASIIANGNLTAEKIKVEITVTGNKWHFFCFPFDVPLSGVSTSGNKAYVFRHYNAEKRATGASGWENLPSDQEVLKAGEGYIFQANGNTTLTVEVDNKTTFVGENVATALKVQDAANVANASWNFKGNPGYAYFDIDDLGFSAPITVWDPNTNNYVALRPGDDDAFLHPFQAFFVQKPEGTDALTFNAEDRTTYHGSQKKMAKKVAHRRAKADADNPRKLVNLVLTDGQTIDKTRVVFNDEKSMAYEMECDAAKFASTGVPQLYSLDGNNTHYSINERPYGDGTVRLGFTADKAGHFAIEAQRMDANCYLRDLENGVTHDLRTGAYDFESKAGTFESRFMLVNADVTDGLKSVNVDEVAKDAVIYDLQGRRVQHAQRGVFIINGKKLNVK